ncbi:uncharacterized protein [Dermacentor albipictus]|uniref:uncharacterized protein n=1 Tax=Dermacentor albipictus TaxID=60249 RepID=UPI0038FCBD31
MATGNLLPAELLQPQLGLYPSQPRCDQQPVALAQPQEQPTAPPDGQVQLWLDPQLQPLQQPQVVEQPYLQQRPFRLPAKPAEQAFAPDSDHSWTVAGAAAFNIFCCSLLRRGMPVMFHAVGETFSTTAKGSVAWTNAFIYSLAYTLSPVTMAMCSVMPLRLLSVAGALLIGVGQIVCYALGSLSLLVPAIALSCGLGAALSSVVDETTLYLHFAAQRQQAALLYHVAFSLSAIVYPLVLSLLLELYGLNGALLVSGAISLNALVGSVFMTRPVWMSPGEPLPPIHRPDGTQITAAAAIQPATRAQEMTAKEDANQKPEAPAFGVAGDVYPTAEKVEVASGAAPDAPTGTSLVGPETLVSAGGDGTPKPGVTTTGGAPPNSAAPPPSNSAVSPTTDKAEPQPTNDKVEPQPTSDKAEPQPSGDKAAAAAPAGSVVPERQEALQEPAMGAFKVPPTIGAAVRSMPDLSVGVILALHCALTSLSVTAGVVVYDYVMDENPERSSYASFTVVSYGAGDLAGRLGYQTLLSTGEHRKVMAVQAFLQGGVLFLMALSKEVVLLAPASFGLGWMSSTLEMLSVPVLQRFLAPDAVEQQLGICRASSGIACLVGPLLVTLFRDDGPQSYAVMFVVSGGLSLLAGALWLPGVKQEMDEAYGKAGHGKAADAAGTVAAYPVLAEARQATAEPGAAKPEEAKPAAAEQGPAVELTPAAAEDTAAKADEANPGPPKGAVPALEAHEPAAPVSNGAPGGPFLSRAPDPSSSALLNTLLE